MKQRIRILIGLLTLAASAGIGACTDQPTAPAELEQAAPPFRDELLLPPPDGGSTMQSDSTGDCRGGGVLGSGGRLCEPT